MSIILSYNCSFNLFIKSDTFRSFQFIAHMHCVRDITNTMLFNNQKEGTKSAAILEYYKTNYTLTEHL